MKAESESRFPESHRFSWGPPVCRGPLAAGVGSTLPGLWTLKSRMVPADPLVQSAVPPLSGAPLGAL